MANIEPDIRHILTVVMFKGATDEDAENLLCVIEEDHREVVDRVERTEAERRRFYPYG